MVVLLIVFLGYAIVNFCFRRQTGMSRFKKLVVLDIFVSILGFTWVLMLLTGVGEIDMYDWYGELTDEGAEWMISFYLTMMLGVGGMGDCCFNLLKYIEEIRDTTYALAHQAESGEEGAQTSLEEKRDTPAANVESDSSKIKMRDVNNGWKCVCCGQANKDEEQRCIECGTEKFESRTAVDDARQAWIIDHNVVCPVCGTMQGTFRSACRNCGTKFVSTEAQKHYLAEREKTWQCQFCDQENPGTMNYCAFCGVERKVIK